MLTNLWPYLVLIGEFIFRIALIVFILLRRRRRAESNLAWITVILVLPVAGMVAYLLVGETRLGWRRRARHKALHESFVRPTPSLAFAMARRPALDERDKPIATLAESVGENGAIGGNRLLLLGETQAFLAALVADIDGAERHCHLLFYLFLVDDAGRRVGDALIRAARRGVACRLLADGVGSRRFLRSSLRREMRAAGVQVVEALPANLVRLLFSRLDLRNHRKIAVIDGLVAYMGSENIADAAFAPKRKFAPWVDASVRVQGPVAHDLQTLFVEDWYLDTNESIETVLEIEPPVEDGGSVTQVMGTGPSSYNEALRQLILFALNTAREEIILTTPYFVPDDATNMALRTAARRGIETKLIVPARNDSPLVAAASRSHYGTLLRAGVQIYEFDRGLLHAKTMTIDRHLALISSANLDRRSFELNFEVSMVVYDTDFASELRFLQTSYLSNAPAVDFGRWRRRPWPRRLLENAAGTLSPLL